MKRAWRLGGSLLWVLTGACGGALAGSGDPALSPQGAASDVPRASSRNVFAPEEQPSRAVHEALLACKEDVQQRTKLTARHAQGWYCVCMTDAESVSRAPSTDTVVAARTCVSFARTTRAKTPDSKRTPHTGKSYLTSGQISGAFQGCVRATQQKPETRALASAQQETFCSCLVDNMRVRRTTSTALPADATRTCAEAAGWTW